MKTFLKPVALRRASPVLVFVKNEGTRYILGVYHELNYKKAVRLKNGAYSGIGKEYDAVQESNISKGLYKAFIKEAIANKKKYNEQYAYAKKHFRKCRKCGCQKRIGEPCPVCSLEY